MLDIIQGSPRPRNTLTEFEPLTLPTELSAVFSEMAAVLLANVSGILVPKATRVIAVMASGKFMRQPKMPARSPMMAVRSPITASEMRNVGQPPKYFAGGIKANMIWKLKNKQ